jgi:23S rRNA (guanosine2251-2'-O)-methyltransferase
LAEPLSEEDLPALLAGAGSGPLLLVLDGLQDPHNLGACLRTAEGAGVTAAIAPRDRAVGLNPTVRKVACGAAECLPFVQVTNLARTLAGLMEHGIRVVGTAGEARDSLYDADLRGPLAVVLGAEEKGLRQLTRRYCDQIVQIPLQGTVESLNVSVAAGIVLFEALRQRSRRAEDIGATAVPCGSTARGKPPPAAFAPSQRMD